MAIFMTPRQVAERWSCSPRHVRRLCLSGELAAMRLGTDWRISVAAVEAHEAGQTSQPAADTTGTAASETGAPVFELPARYEQRFPHLLGMEPATRAGRRKSASRG